MTTVAAVPKRKRGKTLEELFGELRQALYRALVAAKVFERGRQGKQLRAAKNGKRVKRLEKEISILSSLDIHRTAHTHLCAALLKVKPLAACPDLSDEIRIGVQNPPVPEEDRNDFHNVNSALVNHRGVREIVERAIIEVADHLGVALPDKKRGKGKGSSVVLEGILKGCVVQAENVGSGEDRRLPGRMRLGEAAEERVVERLQELLGSSSDDGEDSISNSKPHGASNAAKELDPMDTTTDEEEDDEFDDIPRGDKKDDADEADDQSQQPASDEKSWNGISDLEKEVHVTNLRGDTYSESEKISSPVPRLLKKSAKEPRRPIDDSTFLPSLMCGYISGSDSSASDIEVAPRKNRRGQAARQRIWELKFKEKARHLQNPKRNKTEWDPKRGAVDRTERRSKSRRRGACTADEGAARARAADSRPALNRKERRACGFRGPLVPQPGKDNEGPLHPSWEARKKAKEKQTAKFEGTKITFS